MRLPKLAQWRRLVLALIPMAIVAMGALRAADQDVEALLKQGDARASQHQSRQALSSFRKADKLSPNNVAILARLSEQLGDLAEEEKSEQLARESLAYAQQAVGVAPGNSTAHVDLAIAYGKLTDYTDNKTKLEYSKAIKKEAETALRLDSENALAAHVLGRWHQGIASLNPMLKAMAQLIYGGMPPASMNEAIALLKKAVDLNPRSITYRRSLAQAYAQEGQSGLAKPQWEEILRLPPTEKEDAAAQLEARSVLHFR